MSPATRDARDEAPRDLRSALAFFGGRASPRILGLAAAAGVGVRLALGSWTLGDAALAGAIVAVWPIQEWLIHVFLLHFKPRVVLGVRIDPRNARKHRAHHRDPGDLGLVFVPLHSHAMVLPLLLILAPLLLPTIPLAGTAVATYLVLALHYEWSHFVAHIPYTPRGYRRICRNHVLHHYKSETHWYGVSMLLGDRLMGTLGDPREVPKSPTVRTLGVEV